MCWNPASNSEGVGGRLRAGSRGDSAYELSQGEGLYFHCFGSRFQDSPNMVKFPQPPQFPLDRLTVLRIESELPTPRRSKDSQFSRTPSDEVDKISHADPKRKDPLGILVTHLRYKSCVAHLYKTGQEFGPSPSNTYSLPIAGRA